MSRGATHKAFFISRYGGPEVLQWGEMPAAPLGPQDVRIQVRAASVNPLDLKIRNGELRPLLPQTFPLVLGTDCSGVISEVGPAVTRFKVGDEVYSRVQDRQNGTFAEEVVTAESAVAHKPARLSHAEAASLPLVLLTASQVISEVAGLKEGQWILVHGGAGAVGSATIQLAKARGLNVATTVSGRDTELARELGADLVIDRQKQKFEEVDKDMDAVLDAVDMPNLLRSFASIKPGGTVVSLAAGPDVATAQKLGAPRALWPVMWLLSAKPRLAAHKAGAQYRYWFMHADGLGLESLNPLLEQGRIRPRVDRIFPFEQTPQAIAYVEEGKARGKVVIEMGETK